MYATLDDDQTSVNESRAGGGAYRASVYALLLCTYYVSTSSTPRMYVFGWPAGPSSGGIETHLLPSGNPELF